MNVKAAEIKRQAQVLCQEEEKRLKNIRAAERKKKRNDQLFTRAVADAVEIDNHIEEEKKQWGMLAHTDVNIPDRPIPKSLSQVVDTEKLQSGGSKILKSKRKWQKWEDVYPYGIVARAELRSFSSPALDDRGLQDLLQEREALKVPQAWDLRIAFIYFELERLDLSIKFAELALSQVESEMLKFSPNAKDPEKEVYTSIDVLAPLQQDACHILFESYCKMGHSKRVALDHELYEHAARYMRIWLDMLRWSKEALEEIDSSIQLIRSFAGPRHLKDQAKIYVKGESCLMETLHVDVLEKRLRRDSANNAVRTLQALYYQRKQLDEFMQLSTSGANSPTDTL